MVTSVKLAWESLDETVKQEWAAYSTSTALGSTHEDDGFFQESNNTSSAHGSKQHEEGLSPVVIAATDKSSMADGELVANPANKPKSEHTAPCGTLCVGCGNLSQRGASGSGQFDGQWFCEICWGEGHDASVEMKTEALGQIWSRKVLEDLVLHEVLDMVAGSCSEWSGCCRGTH